MYESVAPLLGWWLALHVLLLVLFPAVLWALWLELPPSCAAARALLIAATIANAGFIAVDGLGSGFLILANQGPALAPMWSSPALIGLADLAGGAFALALLVTAAALYRDAHAGVVLAITALAFLASALPGATPALLISRIAALVAGAAVVYRGGANHAPLALLVFAAVLPQHVGPPAALGTLLVGAALLLRARATGQSVPAAGCPP